VSSLFGGMGVGPQNRKIANFWYVQTAAYATPIPLAYGQNRVAASMIHMPAQPKAQGGGKFGKSGKAQNYTAPVIFGICEGPISGINLLWVDKDQPQLFASGWILNQANEPGTVPGTAPYHFQVAFTSGGLGFYSDVSVYDSTAGVFLTRIPDNASPAPGPGQYQLDGTSNGLYYFNAAQSAHAIWITWFYHSQGTFPGSWVLKLGTTPTQTVWSGLASFPGQGITYPGVAYMAHPAANFPGDSPQQFSYEVEALHQFGGGIVDANGADILTDFLTDPLHGANFPAASLGILSGSNGSYYNYVAAAGLFCSPVYTQQQAAREHLAELFEVTNSAPYWSDGLLKVVPYGDTAMTANGFTFTPNTTPLYSLFDDDFLPNRAVTGSSGADDRGNDLDPILVTRKDPTLIPNKIKVEYVSRDFDYNSDFVVAEDQVSEALNGPIELGSLSLRSVTVKSVARQVAQIRLQREQLVTPIKYEFVLGWKYTGLEPMDLVELNDDLLGLVATPVRIVSVEELADEEGLAFTAEPWVDGVASAVLYPAPGGVGSRPSTNAIPGNTANAFIIEGPSALISAPMELWIGAAGGSNWGGCQVWISTDNVTFQQVGVINGTAAFGTMQPSGLATSASQFPTVDSVNTATVTIITGRQLASLSASDFAHLTYPCVITDGVTPEWMTYETASLVTGSEYALSTLYRGLFGTAPAAHANTDEFMLIDGAVAKIPWPNGVQGATVYFKLPAFNIYGAQLEDLASAATFTYVIGGVPIARTTAVPTMTITVASNDSLTVATAKASMMVTIPPDGASMKWLASTSANPTVAAVIAGGTVVSAGAPFLNVPDLGVALSFGDTVYVTAVYYDQSGNARTAVQGHATRPNLLFTKTTSWPSTLFQAASPPLHAAYTFDPTTGGLFNNSTLGNTITDPFNALVPLPAGAIVTGFTITAYQNPGDTGLVNLGYYTQSAGVLSSRNAIGTTINIGVTTITITGLSINTANTAFILSAIFTGGSTSGSPSGSPAGDLGVISFTVTYNMPNPTAAL
jgi:hypothetical protein